MGYCLRLGLEPVLNLVPKWHAKCMAKWYYLLYYIYATKFSTAESCRYGRMYTAVLTVFFQEVARRETRTSGGARSCRLYGRAGVPKCTVPMDDAKGKFIKVHTIAM
jgi:hypothetical protein